MNIEIVEKMRPVINALRAYHSHEVVGAEHFPKTGGVIFACNHSLASYDIFLFMGAVYESCHRIPRSLIDKLFFKVPGLGPVMQALGSEMGTPENARKLLDEGECITIAPGGMRESLRSSAQKYQIIWEKRRGFAKMAIEAQVPIVLAACPAADDIYDVLSSHVTAWAYKTFRIPLFFAKGLKNSPIPRPVKLTHFVSEPFYPPAKVEDQARAEELLDEFHQRLCRRMQELMSLHRHGE